MDLSIVKQIFILFVLCVTIILICCECRNCCECCNCCECWEWKWKKKNQVHPPQIVNAFPIMIRDNEELVIAEYTERDENIPIVDAIVINL